MCYICVTNDYRYVTPVVNTISTRVTSGAGTATHPEHPSSPPEFQWGLCCSTFSFSMQGFVERSLSFISISFDHFVINPSLIYMIIQIIFKLYLNILNNISHNQIFVFGIIHLFSLMTVTSMSQAVLRSPLSIVL